MGLLTVVNPHLSTGHNSIFFSCLSKASLSWFHLFVKTKIHGRAAKILYFLSHCRLSPWGPGRVSWYSSCGLRSVALEPGTDAWPKEFPLDVPWLKDLSLLEPMFADCNSRLASPTMSRRSSTDTALRILCKISSSCFPSALRSASITARS